MRNFLRLNSELPGWLLLIPLLLLVTWLGARSLNADSIWADEWVSIYNAGGASYGPLSPAEIWNRVLTDDPWQTPLFYLLLSGWGSLVGWTEFASRAMALLAGVLSTAMIYRLGRDLLGDALVGIGASIALSTGAFYVNYLHDLRVYTVYTFLTALFLWSYWQLISRPPKIGRQVVFLLSTISLLYTHYFAVLMLATIAFYHLIFVPKNREWWRVVILMGAASLCFLPWLSAAQEAIALAQSAQRANVELPTLIADVLTMFSSGSIPLLAIVALSVVRIRKRAVTAVWFWAGVHLVLAAVAMQRLSLNEVRYAIGVWIPLALLIGLGMRYSGIKPILLISIWLLVGVTRIFDPVFQNQVHSTFWHQPTRELALALNGHTRLDDLVTFHLRTDYGVWSQNGPVPYYLASIPVRATVFEDLSAANFDQYMVQGFAAIETEPSRVWVTTIHDHTPQRLEHFEQLLRDNDYHYCASITDVAQIDADLWIHYPFQPIMSPAQFEAGISLAVMQSIAVTMNTGAMSPVLPVVFDWSLSPETPLDTYSVGLHIDDSQGQLLRQIDYGLSAGCYAHDLPLEGLPTGDYRFYVVVYNWQTNERVPILDEQAEAVDRLLVTTFSLP